MRIALVAPSSPVDPAALATGTERLVAFGDRLSIPFEFVEAPGLRLAKGYLAGEDDERIAAVSWAFEEPGVDAVWFVRGGFGTTRIVGRLPWRRFAATRRPLLGYSDATAFLAAYHAAGGPAVHAPMVAADLAHSATPRAWESLGRWFQGKEDVFRFAGRVCGGRSEVTRLDGPILSGNIAVLAAMAGTPEFPSGRDRLVCLEEVHEEPYRVDRMLTQLRRAGLFEGAVGIVFGSMTDCVPEDPGKSWSVDEVLDRCAREVDLPAISGFPFGHGGENTVLPWGSRLTCFRESSGWSAVVQAIPRSP